MLGGTQPRCAFSALCPVLGPGLGPERMKCRNEANGPSFRRRTTKAVQRFVSCGREDTKRLVFKPAIADRAPSGASPRVDHYCLPVRESQFARPVGWSRRRPGFCSRSVVGGDGASTLVRGHPGAQSGIAVPRAPGSPPASRGSLGGSVGFSGRAGAVRRGPRAPAARGLARPGGATLERRAKMTRHQCTMSYCTFGMIAAWAIRPADSRSRGLTGSDRSRISRRRTLRRVGDASRPVINLARIARECWLTRSRPILFDSIVSRCGTLPPHITGRLVSESRA
jgi:hypothetical protein